MAETEHDCLILARIARKARSQAQLSRLTSLEQQKAVADLRVIARDRTDLLAECAGLVIGLRGGSQDETAATLCINAGADQSMIRRWVTIGKERAGTLQDALKALRARHTNIRHEDPLLLDFWASEACVGHLYAEMPAGRRRLDGVVALGEPFGVTIGEKGKNARLNGRHTIVIQVKESRLNPYLTGQALLSIALIRQRWTPESIRAVAVHVDDDPEGDRILRRLSRNLDKKDEIEACKVAPHCTERNEGKEPLKDAWHKLGVRNGIGLEQKLAKDVSVAGLVVPDSSTNCGTPVDLKELPGKIRGRDVISLHSFNRTLGMYVAGEMLVAHELLMDSKMGAASVRSVIRCRKGDTRITAAINEHAEVEDSKCVDGLQQIWVRPLNSSPTEWPENLAITDRGYV